MAIAQLELSRPGPILAEAWREGWQPDPEMGVCEWADTFLMLPSETSAEPGKYRSERTPYVREPMRELSPGSPWSQIILMWAAQTGKTTIGLAWIGYNMHLKPGPMMMIQPTIEMAEDVSKERIAPLFTQTPALAARVLENVSRDGDNTIRRKRVRGGFLKIGGANSAPSLRSTPIRDLFPDEIDGYPHDVDGEGRPLTLAEKRQTTFKRGKTLKTSTPSIKHASAIETEFLQSDQRRYFVPCPHCGHMDHLQWKNIDYRDKDPETAALLCTACGALIEERFKTQMLAAGEWRPTAPGDGVRAGFHVNGLYSPLGWFSWKDAVRQWLEAQQDASLLKVFVNTVLAETYEDRGTQTVEPDAILARRETYLAEVPDGVGILVASVDVQGDRLEYQVKGYGVGEESWLIEWDAIPGDPEKNDVWFELDRRLQESWVHASGRRMRISCTTVDSGFLSDRVYEFCRARFARRVFAVKGSKEVEKPLLGRPSNRNSYKARLYPVCVDTGKHLVMQRLRNATAGPGYMHFPEWVDQEYADQLAAERFEKILSKTRGGTRLIRKWTKLRARNEALDLEVYCLAAMRIVLGPTYSRQLVIRAARMSAPLPKGEQPAAAAAGQQQPTPAKPAKRPSWMGRRKGWVDGWKR